jgi:putative ATP-dependent endonuclease of OLD family
MRTRSCLMTDPATAGAALQEITGKRKFRKNEDIPEGVRELGTAAQKLGMLYLVGAFLRSGGARVEQGMTPLILVENPEAHLHPMTLASIWGVIERVEGQKIIGTHSGTLLSSARLSSLRRLTRREGVVHEWRVPEGSLKPDELRRYTYHLRSRRSAASFARCWLLVEGETEFWLMGELARVCGYDFASEGIACVEFAQCGLDAPIKVARHLGIDWHLLADGDAAGQIYVRTALQYASGNPKQRITLLQEPDVEHCFWWHGYANIFRKAAYPALPAHEMREIKVRAKAVIHRAIERQSKPAMAIRLLDAVSDPGSSGVPAPLRSAIETCVRLARGA